MSATLARPPRPSNAVLLQKIGRLEIDLSHAQNELAASNDLVTRMSQQLLRAEQKILKLKSKNKKLKGES